MTFAALLTIALNVLPMITAIPINADEPQQDLLQASHISLQDMANIAMSPHLEVLNKTVVNVQIPVPSLPQLPVLPLAEKSIAANHLLENSKDTAIQTVALPFEVMTDSGAMGAKISAASAIKGSAVGTALATPVILKAVALPGIAAGGTAALFSIPHLIVANAKSATQQLATNVKTSIQDHAQQLNDLLVDKQLLAAEQPGDDEPEDISLLAPFDLQEGINQAIEKVVLLKAGALGAASKGVVMAKKGAYIAGRAFLKPIAILTGIHLKFIGSGLALGGKMIGGTGAGIATAGTAVKFTGLGAIGLGASAVSWGLDKSTIDTRVEANVKTN